MKKIIFPLALILMISLAFASPPVPAPVKILVSVNGEKIDFADTKVTNKYTGEILTPKEHPDLEIKDGFGQFDLSYFKQGYAVMQRGYAGDEIEVVACNVHPSCTNTFILDSTDPRTLSINIVDSSIITPKVIQCFDGTTVIAPAICPQSPQPEPESNLEEYLLALIAGILAIFVWGKGFAGLIKYYLNKAKEEEKKGNKELAQRYRERAKKMAESVVTGFLAGKYK